MLVVSIYLVVKRHTFWSISNFSKRFYDPFFGLGGLLSREVIKYDQLTTSIAHKHWYTYSVIQTKLYLFKWIETGKKNHLYEIPFTMLKIYEVNICYVNLYLILLLFIPNLRCAQYFPYFSNFSKNLKKYFE